MPADLISEAIEALSQPPVVYLTKPQALGFVLNILTKGETDATELHKILERNHPTCRMSATILSEVKRYLLERGIITISADTTGQTTRGCPRKKIRLVKPSTEIQEVADQWDRFAETYLSTRSES
jgi:coenzyme F420-reducing hydrogenase gamma subunit